MVTGIYCSVSVRFSIQNNGNKKVPLREGKRHTAHAAQPSLFCAVGAEGTSLSWPGGEVPPSWKGVPLSWPGGNPLSQTGVPPRQVQ